MIIKLPKKVKMILDALMNEGYEAYAVGGCVRDSLLSRIPDDWDITTSATPEEVKRIFKRTVDTGIQHGTVTVMFGNEGYEVTTYRIDGEYEDNRHPKEVIFTGLLSEDLRRRDFTINAMAYNDRDGLVDIFGGQDDLNKKIIRAVGDAKERFTEDALRIMRAVRFAAQLGYEIEPQTKAAAKELAPNLKKISAERVRTELVKLMTSSHPQLLKTAYEMGITKEILPEFDKMMETEQNHPHHCYCVGEHTIKAYSYIKKEDFDEKSLKLLRLGLLFHDIGKPECHTRDENGIDHFHGHPVAGESITKDILRRLKFDNDTIKSVSAIVRYHDIKPALTESSVRKAVNKIGIDIFRLLFPVMDSDIHAQSEYLRDEKIQRLNELKEIFTKITEKKDPLFIKDLAVNGNDLIGNNLATGKDIGIILKDLLNIVLENPEKNNKEELLKIAKRRVK